MMKNGLKLLAMVCVFIAGIWFFGLESQKVYAEEISYNNGNLLEVFQENKLTFYVTKMPTGGANGKVYLAGCDSSVTAVYVNETIKHNYKEYDIIGINDRAFYGNDNITKVKIYPGLTYIGRNAFWGCSKLKSVTLPNTLTTLEACAFDWCESLTGITIPDKVTSIGYGAFECCRALKTVKLGKKLKTLRERAFYDCEALTAVSLPSKITVIPKDCFSYCYALKSVKMGKNVKTIGSNAFSFCSSLESVTTSGKIETIDEGAFWDCQSLKSFVCDDTVKTINSLAFYECTSLSNIEFNSQLEYIGETAFAHTAVESLTFRGKGLKIDKQAFFACYSLKSVRFEEGVEYIGAEVFDFCMNLLDIDFCSTINYIGIRAFETTKWLDKELGYDPETGAPDYSVFCDYIMINDILYYMNPYEIDEGYPRPKSELSVGEVPYSTKQRVVFDIPKGTRVIVDVSTGEETREVNIPEGVEIIERFQYGGTPDEIIVLPSTLKEVGEGCFAFSTFSSITLPSGLTKLSDTMFRECSNLKSVHMKGEVTSIGGSCFIGTALSSFTLPDTLTYLGENAFSGTEVTSLKLPPELIIEKLPSDSEDFTLYIKKKSTSAEAVKKIIEFNKSVGFKNPTVKYY